MRPDKWDQVLRSKFEQPKLSRMHGTQFDEMHEYRNPWTPDTEIAGEFEANLSTNLAATYSASSRQEQISRSPLRGE